MPRLLNIFCSLSAYIYISVGGGCVFSLSFSPVKKNSKKWGGGRKVGVEHFFAFFNFFSSMGTRFLPRHFTTKDQNKQIIFIYMIIWTTFTHFTNLHFIHCLVWFSCLHVFMAVYSRLQQSVALLRWRSRSEVV